MKQNIILTNTNDLVETFYLTKSTTKSIDVDTVNIKLSKM